MNILILYGSLEGQTAKISRYIAEEFKTKGHRATVQSADKLPDNFSLTEFEAVVVGGSIHISKYPGFLQKYVSAHNEWFNQVPSALFTVCMAINSQNESERQAAQAFGEHFAEVTHWQPDLMQTFAGALKYTQYNFVTRFIMKLIAKREGGSTDTAHDHEYTNWDAVAEFTNQFLIEICQFEKA